MRLMRKPCAAAVLLGSLVAATTASAQPRCVEIAATAPSLAADPAWGKLQSVDSVLVPAAGANAAYCRVDLKYEREINIRVGLR